MSATPERSTISKLENNPVKQCNKHSSMSICYVFAFLVASKRFLFAWNFLSVQSNVKLTQICSLVLAFLWQGLPRQQSRLQLGLLIWLCILY